MATGYGRQRLQQLSNAISGLSQAFGQDSDPSIIEGSQIYRSFMPLYDSADTYTELDNLEALLAKELINNPDHAEVYGNLTEELKQRKAAYTKSQTLPSRIDEFNKKWIGSSYADITAAGTIETIEDVKALKGDWDNIVADIHTTMQYYGNQKGMIPPNIVPLKYQFGTQKSPSLVDKMDQAFSGAIGDLLVTKRINQKDWEILQHQPWRIEEIRKEYITAASAQYTKIAPFLDKIAYESDVNFLNKFWTTSYDGKNINVDVIAKHLGSIVLDPLRGTPDYNVINRITQLMRDGDKTGFNAFITQRAKQIQEMADSNIDILRMWAPPELFNTIVTPISGTYSTGPTSGTRAKFMNKLMTGNGLLTPSQTDLDNLQLFNFQNGTYYFIDQKGVEHELSKIPNRKGTYQLASASQIGGQQFTSAQKLIYNIQDASDFLEIAWNDVDKYNVPTLTSEKQNALSNAGIDASRATGLQNPNVFLKEARDLDTWIQRSVTKKKKGSDVRWVEYYDYTLDKWITLDLPLDYDGAKTKEDFRRLFTMMGNGKKFRLYGAKGQLNRPNTNRNDAAKFNRKIKQVLAGKPLN
jgi:hypothetical protein